MSSHVFDVKAFLDDQGVHFETGGGGHELVLDQCPTCGKSNKFYISADIGKFICFHCVTRDPKMRGGPIGLVMLIGGMTFREAKKLVEGREVDLPMRDDSVSSLLKIDVDSFDYHQTGKQMSRSRGELPDPIKIPRYMLKIDKLKFPQAWKYLSERGISDEVIDKMDAVVSGLNSPREAAEIIGRKLTGDQRRRLVSLFYDIFKARIDLTQKAIEPMLKKSGLPIDLLPKVTEAIVAVKYRDRVIFTVRVMGQVFGWVARDFTKVSTLKVMNSPGPFKYFCLWNFDSVAKSKEVVVCEGIVSAVKCGLHRGVATLGKMVTDEQLKLLQKTSAETIYICLDVDAQREALELKRRLLASFKNVYNVALPPIKLVKCPKCELKHKFDVRSGIESFKCNCGQEIDPRDIQVAVMDADFLDAGDYSPEEMNIFIEEAKEKNADSFLLGDSAFED